MAHARVAFLALTSLALACGPTVAGTTAGGSATGTSAGTSATTTTAGSSSDTTAGTTTTGEACAIFWNAQEVGPPVEVTVTNNTMQTLWFRPQGGCAQAPGLRVSEAGGEPFQTVLDECWPALCSDFMTSDDCLVGCPDCVGPTLGRLGPGGKMTATWRGNLYHPLEMIASCAKAGEACQVSCVREEQAQPTVYDVGFTLFQACEGVCDCDGPASEVCYIYDQATGSEELPALKSIDYPDETTVDLVVQ